ncbi:MAG: 50S ribosomal protein L13 [Candidatus Aminicenantes bacterium]|jgi:large subunit ribosomal protein L13|nr:50S ribosomal protein L13 [Candidatus Aminicenantes bacterium]
MKTFVPKKGDIERKWWILNAEGKVLGRLATEAAVLLRGKHKPMFAAFVDTGDFVVVINAAKIVVTGKKAADKEYYSHSGYPGGLKTEVLQDLLASKPEEVIKRAVWGMIPKNKLGRAVYKKLKVYPGAEHPHVAQNPQEHRF